MMKRFALLAALLAACGDNVEVTDDGGDLTPLPDAAPAPDAAERDECAAAPDLCGSFGTCVDTPGAYTCACPAGWTATADDCVPPPCAHQYTAGHGDMYVSWDADTGLTLALRSELEPGQGERAYPALDVCIAVPRSTYDDVMTSFGGRPPGAGWDPVGVEAGESFWYLPEQPIEGVPWFGIASDVSAAGGVPIGVLGDALALAIEVHPPAGAAFSAWGAVDDKTAPPFVFATATDLREAALITGSHMHLSWAFTRPGEYLVEAIASGVEVATGQTRTSPPAIFRFVVEP